MRFVFLKMLRLIFTIIPLFVIISMLFWKCANIQGPSGGVKDTISPVILESSPANNTLNFNGDKVKVKFSKYMNSTSVNDNIFIQPEVKAEYRWWAKKLTIKFLEDLKENTTYSIQFGTSYTDWKNNKPLYDYSIIFSTGEVIDSGQIKGTVFGEDIEGSFVYAFPLTDDDSLVTRKPIYRAQLSQNGVFFINALKEDTYRLFAIKDKYDNKIYDPEVDNFGAAMNDVSLSDSNDIYFRLGKALDRSSPVLNSTFTKNNRILEVSFSENLSLELSSELKFFLMDSLKRNKTEIEIFAPKDKSSKSFDLLLPDDLEANLKYLIEVESAIDSSGNEIIDSNSTSMFVTSSTEFDQMLELTEMNFQDSTSKFDPSRNLSFWFNTFVDLSEKINVFKDSTRIDFELFENGFNQIIYFDKMEESNYKIEIDLRNSNKVNPSLSPDTTLIFSFKTSKYQEFSKLSGTFKDSSSCNSRKIMFLKNIKDSVIKTIEIKEDNWEIDSVMAGDYYIEVICDEDSNGVYSFGNDIPFRHSEYFQITNKAIKVKERWDVEDIEVVFK